VGLLIVNADLGKYGLLSMSLARPEYVLTGAMWALLMVLTISSYWRLEATIRHVLWRLQSRAAKLFYSAIGVSGLILLFVTFLLIAIHSNEPSLGSVFWIAVGTIANAWFLLSISVSLRRPFQRHFGEEPPPQAHDAVILDPPWKLSVWDLSSTVISFLVGLGVYASLAFPYIPRDWGGGAKPSVTLFLKEKAPAQAVGIAGDGNVIGPALCLQETEQSVIVGIKR